MQTGKVEKGEEISRTYSESRVKQRLQVNTSSQGCDTKIDVPQVHRVILKHTVRFHQHLLPLSFLNAAKSEKAHMSYSNASFMNQNTEITMHSSL